MTTKKPAKAKARRKPAASPKTPKTAASPKARKAKASAEAAAKAKLPLGEKAAKAGVPKAPRAGSKKTLRVAASPSPTALRQVAALPLRRTDTGLEVLLITSRETHRWVIPKGWPMKKKTDPQAAATEALEEGGLLGDIAHEPLGAYTYFKRREEHFDLVDVAVYRLDVTGQEAAWREKDQREQRWCALSEAAGLVQEPGLKLLLDELADRL